MVKALRKTEFLSHSSKSYVTIIRDYAGLSLTGNRNQNGISSGLKRDRGRLRNLSSGRESYESFSSSISLRNKTSISTKWSLNGGWSLTESGRYERVDCSFEFYPPQRQKHNATDRPY